ncbi:unnamed protein product [Mesocestoides corti]|uniref:Tetraspanin n=1 Tax=Mesocestoides corti TaxID=53468 RepID=A0A0R3U628_MESCO|nr:unnamed protein product [Mesocestoides corti]
MGPCELSPEDLGRRLAGVALVVAGSWAVFNISSFLKASAFALDADFANHELCHNAEFTQTLAYVCIGFGLFVFMVAFFGCCGVVTDSYCLLITYAVIVSLLFLAKVVSVLVFLLLGDKKMLENFSANYKGYLGITNHGDSMTYSQAMDTAMIKLECCGLYGPQDFEQVETSALWHKEGRTYVDSTGQTIVGDAIGLPIACCQFRNRNFPMNSTYAQMHRNMKSAQCPVKPISAYNKRGCIEVVSSALRQYTVVIAVTPVIIAVIEVVGVILASALAHEVKQDVDQMYY